jgi:hypothetical protein
MSPRIVAQIRSRTMPDAIQLGIRLSRVVLPAQINRQLSRIPGEISFRIRHEAYKKKIAWLEWQMADVVWLFKRDYWWSFQDCIMIPFCMHARTTLLDYQKGIVMEFLQAAKDELLVQMFDLSPFGDKFEDEKMPGEVNGAVVKEEVQEEMNGEREEATIISPVWS